MFTPQTDKKDNYEVMEVLINSIAVIILLNIYIHINITLYTLKLHNIICQLYLKKHGKNKL